MANPNWKQIYARKKSNSDRILKVNPNVPTTSGIYFIYRNCEDGSKAMYVGQAVNLLERLSSHLQGYQYIDNSIRSHKFYDEKKNTNGYKISFKEYPKDQLDRMEKVWIAWAIEHGYVIKNQTTGSQGEGKSKIDGKEPRKYRDGLLQGYNNALKEVTHFLSTHCIVNLKNPNNKVSRNQAQKWKDKISIENFK